MAYPPTYEKSFALTGGYDLINSMMGKDPGSIIAGENIQIISGKSGYSRIDGIERCTNDTLASNARPIYLLVTDNTATLSIGDTGTSGGITVICLADISGTGEKVVPVVCSDQTEDLSGVSSLTFSGGSIDVASVVADSGYFTSTEIGTFKSLAKDYFLEFIPEVPGSGTNNGGFRLRGVNYVFNGGVLYKGGELSWTAVEMPDVMYFDSGISEISVGDIITDGVETATIASVTRQTGSWNHTYEEPEQSAGYFTLTDATGDFTIDNDLVIDGATVPSFVNGDFSADTDWTKGDGCTIADGKATVAAHTEEDTLSQDYALSDGDVVELTIVLSGVTAGTITPTINDDEGLPDEGTALSEDGTHTVLIAATKDTTVFELVYDADFLGSVESITAAVGRRAKVKTVNEPYVLPDGGDYEVKIANFTNIADNDSAFGCSGTGEAFEFDGTNYIPIYYPDTDKFPKYLMIHQKRLFLCYPGGEILYSVSNQPRVFNSLLGAGSYSTLSEITGCSSIHGNAALVLCKNARWFLTGDGIYDDTSATRNWSFFSEVESVGGEAKTIVNGDKILFVGGGKVFSLSATDTTAGYSFDDVSEMFAPVMVDKIGESTCAIWVDSKSQYRVFFDKGHGICISFRAGYIQGATPIEIPFHISNIWKSIEDGKEHIFFTATDSNYLYKMDSGDSMDGSPISGSFRIPFHGYGYERYEKEYPVVVIGMSAPVFSENTTIKYTVNFDYGSPKSPLAIVHEADDIDSVGGLFGANAGFGNFVWSGTIVSEIFACIDGYGANMSLLVTFETKNDLTFAFQTVSVDYIIHGRKGRG